MWALDDDLHSTMYLLNQSEEPVTFKLILFTFHYVSIKSN